MTRTVLAFISFFVLGLSFSHPAEAQQTFLQQAALAADADFTNRVKIAMVKNAYTVSLETTAPTPCTGKESACAQKRMALAAQVAANPAGWATQFSTVVVGDTSITAVSTDQNLTDRVYQIWNLMSGVQAQ